MTVTRRNRIIIIAKVQTVDVVKNEQRIVGRTRNTISIKINDMKLRTPITVCVAIGVVIVINTIK